MKQPLVIKPSSPKFRPLYEKNWRYVILKSGRGSGKSWAIAESIIYYTTKFRTRILCARQVQNSIKDSVHKLLSDTIDRLGVTDAYEITRDEIRCKATGSLIIFRGLKDNLTSLKSLEGIDIVWLEEAEAITDEAYDILIPTIRKPNSVFFISFNPRLETDATYRRFVLNPPDKTAIIELTQDDNPFFPDVLRDEMEHDKLTDPDRYRWVWLGECIGVSESKIIPEKLVKDALTRIPVTSEEGIVLGLDPARYGDDKTGIVIRSGHSIVYAQDLKGLDANEIENTVERLCVDYDIAAVVVDSCGLGAPIYDHLKVRLKNVSVHECNAAWKADDGTYGNKRAELWGTLRKWLVDCGSLREVPSKDWLGELCTIDYYVAPNGKLMIESKESLRRRGIKSPNLADALALSLQVNPNKQRRKISTHDLYGGSQWMG